MVPKKRQRQKRRVKHCLNQCRLSADHSKFLGFAYSARSEKSVSAPPTKNIKMPRITTPSQGRWQRHELTSKRPTIDKSPQKRKSRPKRQENGQDFRLFFFHSNCRMRSAAASSHGMNDAFSTGSQNQKPPSPVRNRPPTPKGDTDGQKYPRRQGQDAPNGPRLHHRPSISAATQRKGHAQPHVSQVRRGMKGQTRSQKRFRS